MKTITTLKPCPCCASKNVELSHDGPTKEQLDHIIGWGEDYDCSYWVQCNDCGMTTNPHIEKEECINVWQQRVAA